MPYRLSGAAGQASAAVNQAAVIKEKLRQKMKQQAMQSLDMPAPKIASEFYTEEEMASFKKVKKKVSVDALFLIECGLDLPS